MPKKKTGEARQSRHKSKAQQNNEGDALGSTSLLSPSGGFEILARWVFVLDVTRGLKRMKFISSALIFDNV